jgi:hypothetical protein
MPKIKSIIALELVEEQIRCITLSQNKLSVGAMHSVALIVNRQ